MEAFDAAFAADPEASLVLLVEMAAATDERLRAAARRLAARVVLDRARAGLPRARGTRRLRRVPADAGGDLDLDASLEVVAAARAEGRPVGLDELVARDWATPELALCLVIDRSGSMGGERLAAAALTAAACALRAPGQHAVLAFAGEVTVLRSMELGGIGLGGIGAGGIGLGDIGLGDRDAGRAPPAVLDAILALRGHGTTLLAGALTAAAEQLARTRAGRKVVVLLSDCRATDEQDPVTVARRLDELVILAPADDSEAAQALARRAGARFAALTGAADAPRVLAELLGAP